jgi:hypothetical protein
MRFKDFELPYQRGVMLLGLLYVLVRKLVEWLSTDALDFDILFLGEGDKDPLVSERALLTKLFHEEIKLDIVHIRRQGPLELPRYCEEQSRRSMVHVLMIGVNPTLMEARDCGVSRLAVNGPRPAIGDGVGELNIIEGDDASDSWANALQGILMRWV